MTAIPASSHATGTAGTSTDTTSTDATSTDPTAADRARGHTAVRARGLRKTYGTAAKSVTAVDGIDLDVASGTIFALLGPNGAGKSTTVKLLTTLARPDAGTAEVAGVDVLRDPAEVRRRIGYVSQRPGFDPVATGRENLMMQARVYGLRAGVARLRSDELLEQFGLAAAANRLLRTWSGGMQRKLDVAMGLIHHPQVLFLDEPTTGLDPEARSEMWSHIATLAASTGLTVVLTTHYLDEADRLADRLVIIDAGRVVAEGAPEQLKGELHGDTVQIGVATPDSAAVAVTVLAATGLAADVSADGAEVRARVPDGPGVLGRLVAALGERQITVTAVTVARPSLDDVYLRYAGRSFRGATATPAARSGHHNGDQHGGGQRGGGRADTGVGTDRAEVA